MKVVPVAGFEGLLIIQPDIYHDDRGFFFESFNLEKYAAAGLGLSFVQDNHSVSVKNVIRGLHYQAPPHAQGKLVRVANGSALDVVVDIRKNAVSYGKSYSLELTAARGNMLWIPPGFAHGFAALEDNTVFLYKCTGLYDKQSEGGILYNDPDLAIDWKIDDPIVSDKDLKLGSFSALESPF